MSHKIANIFVNEKGVTKLRVCGNMKNRSCWQIGRIMLKSSKPWAWAALAARIAIFSTIKIYCLKLPTGLERPLYELN